MHKGKVHEAGSADILSSPATPELAQFVGTGL
jgi:polar amino acid transport system ATP-binding protein